MQNKNLNNLVDFLFETGMLAKTPRSGFFFLGSGEQSVAEHSNRTIFIGYVLATMADDVDLLKVLQMCIFHDLAEARVSDLNYVHQKYTERKEHEAINDLTANLFFGNNIKNIIAEYENRETKEAKLAKDADNLEFLLSLKEQYDIGNERAHSWTNPVLKRLMSDEAKELGAIIIKTDSDRWWYGDKNSDWWVDRKKN